MTQNILIEFSSNTEGIETAALAVESLGDSEKQLAKDFAATNASIKEREKTLAGTNSQVGEFANKLKQVDKAAAGNIGKKLFDEIGKAGVSALSKISAQMNTTATNAKKLELILGGGVEDALKEAGITAEQFKNGLKSAGVTLEEFATLLSEGVLSSEDFQAALGETESKSVKLKTRLREIKEELAQMDIAGESGSQRFRELAREAGQLEDQIGDTSARVKALASDTANIDAALSGLQTLASGFQLVTAAQALMGTENEELQKTLVKLNAVMAATSAIQQIVNAIQKDTVLVMKAQAVVNAVVAASTRLTAGAFAALGISVTASSVAFKVLRAALISTGIGALVVLVGALISKLDEWTSSTESAADAQDRMKASTEAFTAAVEDQIDALDYDNKLLKLRAQLAGASEKEITAISRKEIEDRINLRNKEMIAATNAGLDITELAKANSQDIQALTVFDLEQQISAREKNLNSAKEYGTKQKDLAARNAKALFEIQQRALEQETELLLNNVNNTEGPFALRLQSLVRFNARTLDLIEVRRQQELAAEGLTAIEVRNINDKYNQERLQQLADFSKTRNELLNSQREADVKESQDFYQQLLDAEANAQAGRVKNINDLYAKLRTSNNVEQDKQLADAKKKYDEGLLTTEQYEAERARIAMEFNRREINNELAQLQALLTIRKAAGEDVTDVEASILEANERLRQIDLQKAKDVEAQKLDTIKQRQDAEKKFFDFVTNQLSRTGTISGQIGAALLTTAQQLKGIFDDDTLSKGEKTVAALQAATQIAAQAIDAVFSAQAQRRKEELDIALNDLDRQFENEINAKNLTEAQKLNIEERYRVKERQIKTQAAIKDRKAQQIQAAAQGTLAAINALASIPFPFNIAAAALIGGMVVWQIAELNKLPLPQFRHGGVNIDGPGTSTSDSILARISKGESVMTAEATKRYEPMLEAMNSLRFDDYIDKIVAARMPMFDVPQMTNLPKWTEQPASSIDYDAMAKAFVKEVGRISDVPGTHVNIDKDGIVIMMKKGMDSIIYKNSRYSTK